MGSMTIPSSSTSTKQLHPPPPADSGKTVTHSSRRPGAGAQPRCTSTTMGSCCAVLQRSALPWCHHLSLPQDGTGTTLHGHTSTTLSPAICTGWVCSGDLVAAAWKGPCPSLGQPRAPTGPFPCPGWHHWGAGQKSLGTPR